MSDLPQPLVDWDRPQHRVGQTEPSSPSLSLNDTPPPPSPECARLGACECTEGRPILRLTGVLPPAHAFHILSAARLIATACVCGAPRLPCLCRCRRVRSQCSAGVIIILVYVSSVACCLGCACEHPLFLFALPLLLESTTFQRKILKFLD